MTYDKQQDAATRIFGLGALGLFVAFFISELVLHAPGRDFALGIAPWLLGASVAVLSELFRKAAVWLSLAFLAGAQVSVIAVHALMPSVVGYATGAYGSMCFVLWIASTLGARIRAEANAYIESETRRD